MEWIATLTVVSATQLIAAITAADIASPGNASVNAAESRWGVYNTLKVRIRVDEA